MSNLTKFDRVAGGGALAGKKTEIAASIMAILNGANQIACNMEWHCVSLATMQNINALLLAVVALALGSRVTRAANGSR